MLCYLSQKSHPAGTVTNLSLHENTSFRPKSASPSYLRKNLVTQNYQCRPNLVSDIHKIVSGDLWVRESIKLSKAKGHLEIGPVQWTPGISMTFV